MVNKICDIVLTDHRMKIREIAVFLNISIERVENILHEKSSIRWLSARQVPRLFTVEQKRNRTRRITLQIVSSSILFSRFGLLRFLFVPKHENMAWRKEVRVKRSWHDSWQTVWPFIAGTKTYFAKFDKTFFLDGFKKFKFRWTV